jgi:hypothetical protein
LSLNINRIKNPNQTSQRRLLSLTERANEQQAN